MNIKTAVKSALKDYSYEKDKITREFMNETRGVVTGVSAVQHIGGSVEDAVRAALWIGFLMGRGTAKAEE